MGLILPTFYAQILHEQISKHEKYSQAVILFFAFGIWALKQSSR